MRSAWGNLSAGGFSRNLKEEPGVLFVGGGGGLGKSV